MSGPATLVLLPFMAAFLAFVLRFYSRESAASVFNASFLLALLTVALAGTYLGLGATSLLFPYATTLFAAIGVALLVLALFRALRF